MTKSKLNITSTDILTESRAAHGTSAAHEAQSQDFIHEVRTRDFFWRESRRRDFFDARPADSARLDSPFLQYTQSGKFDSSANLLEFISNLIGKQGQYTRIGIFAGKGHGPEV